MKSFVIREIKARSILTKSRVHDYTVNPYVGCLHSCVYCYAQFMRRFTGHAERWGEFVDIKINEPELLIKEVRGKKKGRVWISGICDPYQPLEREYGLTKRCLEILIENHWPVTIQTKSPLVLRDIDILKSAGEIEVGITVTTADEGIRKLFEPRAPSIRERIHALMVLQSNGIRTFAMIAPILPGADGLVGLLKDHVDYVILDRLNYHYADWVYRRHGLTQAMGEGFFKVMKSRLTQGFRKEGVKVSSVF